MYRMFRKPNRYKKLLSKLKRRKKQGYNLHHLTPKSRGGKDAKENLLYIRESRHNLWHRLWGNRTLEEVVSLLTRLVRMKGRGKKYQIAA